MQVFATNRIIAYIDVDRVPKDQFGKRRNNRQVED